ncbi:c-type cytochrome [Duganella sp. CT11-25]|uniref:c-type cytochrome n=1 Tax=unclassified Duganella TaxID=2636909 RepID=UPI0039AFE302
MKILLFAALASLAQAQDLTPQQQRGRAVYMEGKGSATAGGNVLPARLFPCASCHGDNGRGQREGGTGVADITPQALARAATVGERSRPAYTAVMLRHAIAGGVDSGGMPLDRVMPRYQLQPRDAGDLLAYLAILDTVAPPGVSADAVRIKVIGAPGLAAPAQSIYGRRIVLLHGRAEDTLLTIDSSAAPGAAKDRQIAALRDYAAKRGDVALLLADDCRALQAETAAPLVLMTADAASRCNLDGVAAAPDRTIIVAAPEPPGSDAAAQAQLELVAATLARIGRDFTRKRFAEALEQGNRAHAGQARVWLMTLDVHKQALLAEPGWWRVPRQ